MTTTVPVQGGPAHPVRQDNSGLKVGGPALPVYGFADEAAAAAAGYPCEGGPASSVYVVSAAQLANGQFYLEGTPAAMPVYTAPVNSPVEGDYAQAVYLVGGSL